MTEFALANPLTEIAHLLRLAEHAVRSAETANDLDSFHHFRDEAARCLQSARTAATAAAALPGFPGDRLPSLALVA